MKLADLERRHERRCGRPKVGILSFEDVYREVSVAKMYCPKEQQAFAVEAYY